MDMSLQDYTDLMLTLMVCVKDTATRPRLTLVRRLPRVCTPARGRMLFACNGMKSSPFGLYGNIDSNSHAASMHKTLGKAVIPYP